VRKVQTSLKTYCTFGACVFAHDAKLVLRDVMDHVVKELKAENKRERLH